MPDGQITPGNLTVQDSQLGAHAQITLPSASSALDSSGVPITNPNVNIDIWNCFRNTQDPTCQNPPSFPNFKTDNSVFTSIVFTDASGTPIPNAKIQCGTNGATGASITLPLNIPAPLPDNPNQPWNLKYFDKQAGQFLNAKDCLSPTMDAVGQVTTDRLSVRFDHIAQFSVFLAAQRISLLADANSDGKVDCQDVAVVRAAFGKRQGQAGYDPRADMNGDLVINVQDLAYVTQKLPPGTVCR